MISRHGTAQQRNDIRRWGACGHIHWRIHYPFCGTFAVPSVAHELGGMPDHKASFSTSQDRRPWWRVWNDYANPTLDALLGLFGIAVIVIVFWFLTTG